VVQREDMLLLAELVVKQGEVAEVHLLDLTQMILKYLVLLVVQDMFLYRWHDENFNWNFNCTLFTRLGTLFRGLICLVF
jgi:hypothetical protein